MLHYKVTVVELQERNPRYLSKVLQTVFNAPNTYDLQSRLARFIKGITPKLKSGELTIEQINYLIRAEVLLLQRDYPSSFTPPNELGWYSRILLAKLFESGRLSVAGYTMETLLANELPIRQALDKELLAMKAETAARELVKEEARLPITIGMVFKSKTAIARAYLGDTTSSKSITTITRRLAEFVTVESILVRKTKHWEIIKVITVGGKAYPEDLV